MLIKTTLKYDFPQKVKITKNRTTKKHTTPHWKGCGETGALLHCW